MLLDLISDLAPEWMFSGPRRQWSSLMALAGVTLDLIMEGINQARSAAEPGQVPASVDPNYGGFLSVDALPLIGRDRRILRGLNETPDVYAGRLRQWLQSWGQAATPWGLLVQLGAVIGSPEVVRIVTAGGAWWTWDGTTVTMLNTAGTGFSYTPSLGALTANSRVANSWNWDSNSNPPPYDQNDPSRFWVIVYAPVNAPYMTANDLTFSDAGVVNDLWNNPTSYYANPSLPGTVPTSAAGTIGLSAPQNWVELLRNVISEWKSAGLACAYVIVSFDPTAFNPVTDSTPTSIPDGTWGWHGWYNPSTGIRAPSRFPNAEYIVALPGGQRS